MLSASARQLCLVFLSLLIGFCLPVLPLPAVVALLIVTTTILFLFARGRRLDAMRMERSGLNRCLRCGYELRDVPKEVESRCPHCGYEPCDEM